MRRFIALCAGLLLASGAAAQAPPVPQKLAPQGLSGAKTANGVRIVSRRPDNAFSIELAGKSIRPLSQERLQWNIDGKTIELELAAFPRGTAGAHPPADLLRIYRDWELAAGSRQGWRAQGSAETLSLADAKPGLLWSARRTGQEAAHRHAAAALNNDGVLVLSATAPDGGNEAELKAYLRSAMATVKWEVPAAQDKPPSGGRPGEFKGMPLSGIIHLNTSLKGVQYGALVNKSLVNAQDAKIGTAIQLEPASMLEVIRFLLLSEAHQLMQTQVFDGRSSHSFLIYGAEMDADVFTYSDTWGAGKSFLAPGSNAAGVSAWQHAGMWQVKGEELEKVLYAVLLPLSEIIESLRLFALLQRPPERLIETYTAVQAADGKNAWIAEANLRKIAIYFRKRKAFDHALAMFRAIAALYPASPTAAQELAQAYKDAGQSPPPAAPAAVAAPDRSGDRLALIRQTEFFRWFQLEPVGAQRAQSGHMLHLFKPSGPKFRELVTLVLYAGAGDLVDQRTLVLSRSFIDDRQQGAFARDIAKSHIAAAVLKDEQPQVADLVEEMFGMRSRKVTVPAARRDAEVPHIASPAVFTFRGGQKRYQQQLKHSTLFLENRDYNKQPTLVISVTRKGS